MKVGTRVQWMDKVGTVIANEQEDDGMYNSVTVRWDAGKIETLTPEWDAWQDLEDVTPRLYVNVYLHDRDYGGPEEGGWWYDTYEPVVEECRVLNSVAEADAVMAERLEWCRAENSQRRSNITSVASEGRYEVINECFPAECFPARKPRYS